MGGRARTQITLCEKDWEDSPSTRALVKAGASRTRARRAFSSA